MIKKYLDINSAFRNRNTDPLAGEFNVPISISGDKNSLTSVDPVSLAASIVRFSPNDFDSTGGLNFTGVITLDTDDTVIFTAAAGTPPQINEDYYIGSVFTDTTTPWSSRIIGWTYLYTIAGARVFRVKLDQKTPTTILTGDAVSVTNQSNISDTSNPVYYIPTLSETDKFPTPSILYNETVRDYRTITNVDEFFKMVHLDGTVPIAGWALTDTYSLRENAPSEAAVATASTINSVTLAATASAVDSFYNGSFISIDGQERRIVAYNGTTKVATVNPLFSSIPVVGTYLILPFSYDNLSCFSFTDGQICNQEYACYEIELIHLILPNQPLNVSENGRIVFYPYVYVMFQNLNKISQNLIYSNNPNSRNMTFKVAVDDINDPLDSKFIKLNGNGMVQTVKFKPNDNIKFAVKLPDGSVFSTKELDSSSPRKSKSQIQISALFSFKRI